MKVKIIRSCSVSDLEYDINKFLKDISDDQIVDIKYQGVGNHGPHSLDRVSAMIILRETKR